MLIRLVQFASRVLWTSLEDCGVRAVKLKQLEDALSTTRKGIHVTVHSNITSHHHFAAIQMGRFVDMLYSARESVRLNSDVHRITLTMSKIATALFILVDNMLWLARVGICDIDRRKWFLTSCRLWLYSITMNLIRDWFEVRETLFDRRGTVNSLRKRETRSLSNLVAWINAYPALSVDILKNSCDFFIPMSALNYFPLSPKSIGALGLVSSGCALLQVTDPSLRLYPS